MILGVDVGARRDERAAGQRLLEVWVLPAVQLVDRQLPHGVRPRGTVLSAGGGMCLLLSVNKLLDYLVPRNLNYVSLTA